MNPTELGPLVSRETAERLATFAALLRKWQKRINLIAPSTVPELETRHIADCVQLVTLHPDMRRVADLGSGAGFPGIVLAILLAEHADSHVHLVESNHKKAGFLREALRVCGVSGTVHADRIEAVVPGLEAIDTVTARALAPLDQLLTLSHPLLRNGAVGLFQKGREYREELARARGHWSFDLIVHQSVIDVDSVVLRIENLVSQAAPPRPA